MASAMETLCGQAYGTKQYHMMGIYLQRSWLILLGVAVLLTPTYIFSGQLLTALGQPAELSRQADLVSMYMLPLHFVYAIILPLNKFLESQRKSWVAAVATAAAFPVHVAATWLLAAGALLPAWGLRSRDGDQLVLGPRDGGADLLCLRRRIPETWRGFSASAFVDLNDFVKLSAASVVMIWYVPMCTSFRGCCACFS